MLYAAKADIACNLRPPLSRLASPSLYPLMDDAPRPGATLPTELWLAILDPLVSAQYALSAPQPADIQRTLHSLCLTCRALHAVASPYLYNCLSIKSSAQLEILLEYAFARPRRVRTLIYSGPLRAFPTDSVIQLLGHVAPTLERLFLSLSLGMPLATYNNPLILLRPALQRATRLREFGSFSNASDEIIFPLRRQMRRTLQPAPEVLHWPGVQRVALVSLSMGGALQLAPVLPDLRSLVIPAQALEDGFTLRLHSMLQSLPIPADPRERKDLIWVRYKDNMEEGDPSGAWFLFHFLPVVERLAERNSDRVRVWLLHAPVGRMGLGWWMMQRMQQGEMWRDMGIRLGQDSAEGGQKPMLDNTA
ncbi:hypothetical protein CALVIDRAFT_171166 [Calocera viscosa TUFC12733]|uniref:F-box domain-containing protein n=1 Tax=Calocera viscosa (strain TUFC12733) TaxID=1330018 RepID=A0A167L8H4_CALVF|nr:hypothetical protein CALVIDRAFT_171166 [Calocera viscosa TUFC12733]